MATIPTITAFESSPDRGRGFARDMLVRWALEEVGQPYEVRLLSFKQLKEPAHLAIHPFGKIPTFETAEFTIFETGAIIFHIAETYPGLFPKDAVGRMRAITWMFSTLSTIEPAILELEVPRLIEREKSWYNERLPLVVQRVRSRINELSNRLGKSEWLEDSFSAGDLIMVSALRRLGSTPILAEFSNLAAYVERGMARLAFQCAFAAQLAIFSNQKDSK